MLGTGRRVTLTRAGRLTLFTDQSSYLHAVAAIEIFRDG